MPRSKTPHPADAANAEILAQAVRFDVALFLGAGRYAKASAPTLVEAQVEATRLSDQHATAAKPLIYGVTAEGQSALVTAATPRGRPFATYSSRFNALRAARSALGSEAAEDRDFITRQEAAGWVWTPVAAREAVPPPAGDLENAVPVALPTNGSRAVRRTAALMAAQAGQLPSPPDFTAPTHARFRTKLADLVALVEAGDVERLKAVAINPVSTSPKALARYRDLAVLAIEVRAAGAAATQAAA